jgi:4-amino-4-deoxy-L-arabinose transferase-like glycosyltransferase
MFGRRAGWIAGFVYAASLGAMLYAVNATAEAMLTFFCTWSFAECWWARVASSNRVRLWHLIRFYIALGLAMLTKGPMPLAVVGLPLVIWWWLDRPLHLVSIAGLSGIGQASRLGVRQFLPRLREVFTRWGAWWGLPLFLLMFVPWMVWVARHTPYAWELWEYEYLDRMSGRYPGVKTGRWWYYVPILLALVAPWSLSLPQALALPFQRENRAHRKPLRFVWFWIVVTFVVTSFMKFKKPYYVLPAVPGCALLLSVIFERMFFEQRPLTLRARRGLVVAVLVIGVAGLAIGWLVGRNELPDVWHGVVAWTTPLLGAIVLAGMVLSAGWFVAGKSVKSFVALGCTSMTVFAATWITLGPTLGNEDAAMALVSRLSERGVPHDVPVYWAGNRPDGRVLFYGNRQLRQVADPYKLIAERRDEMSLDDIRDMMVMRICEMLEDGGPVLFVFQRGQFETLMALMNPPARELFSIDRARPGRDKNDWVVVTNRASPSPGQRGQLRNVTPLAAR